MNDKTDRHSDLPCARVGDAIPPWREGCLDLHHINTGAGDAGFFILPDGTTLLFDAGELDPTTERYNSPRQAAPKPDGSRRPFEWISDYIRRVHPTPQDPVLDYAILTHFHEDHLGEAHTRAPTHPKGGFLKTGFTGVCSELPVKKVIDRGHPAYDYPIRLDSDRLKGHFRENPAFKAELRMIENYLRFLDWIQSKGTTVEAFRPGALDQISLQKRPDGFPDFECRIVCANGELWSGDQGETRQLFPDVETLEIARFPSENACSAVTLFKVGKFTYFNGADIPGIPHIGDPEWTDVESPVAEVVGPVDVQVLNHHGYRNTQNQDFTRTLSPRVFVQQNWSADQPGHDVLLRMISEKIYPGPRDLFATNMLDANRHVIGPRIDSAFRSTSGHILVRVEPDGRRYWVLILDDSDPRSHLKEVFGPYAAR
ncbi:MAG: hypothetical protein DRP71_08375 [Verrucomicrobia bacterium]|nr:MAG: hypothetical protein DRP71_08375 [Verrucomicrobiota bacterium]